MFSGFYSAIKNTELETVFGPVKETIDQNYSPEKHGDVGGWLQLLNTIPGLRPSVIDLDQSRIVIGKLSDCDDIQRDSFSKLLLQFQPWRKGPFDVFGIRLDTEWRSDWKWDRLKDGVSSLKDKTILDVGCGNGYHCLRMLGAGAKRVVGIDPTLLYVTQFFALNKFINTDAAHVLPLALEDLPENKRVFDTVFSMGVIYHRKSPQDHLARLYGNLREGGELVMESLVIEGEQDEVLKPEGRYAKMRNVWQIPTVKALESWLTTAGFENIRLLDVSVTTTEEQHCTDWMRFESLADFLDPSDHTITIEGLPAPQRAILVARKP